MGRARLSDVPLGHHVSHGVPARIKPHGAASSTSDGPGRAVGCQPSAWPRKTPLFMDRPRFYILLSLTLTPRKPAVEAFRR